MHAPAIIDCPSPNHEPRPAGVPVDLLIVHYTGMLSAEAARDRLCDIAARVSAHYMIDEDGQILRLVPEDRRAFHAGVSYWRGERDINSRSLGIELVNPGHEFGYRPFPPAQIAAFTALARDIMARHAIAAERVLGHSDVAPQRKCDPGELFDWRVLARHGIGVWPFDESREAPGAAVIAPDVACTAAAQLQATLAGVGYETPQTGVLDAATRAVVIAFQRHFRPARLDGVVDRQTLARLDRLVGQQA